MNQRLIATSGGAFQVAKSASLDTLEFAATGHKYEFHDFGNGPREGTRGARHEVVIAGPDGHTRIELNQTWTTTETLPAGGFFEGDGGVLGDIVPPFSPVLAFEDVQSTITLEELV